jgi:ATP-binding cassette subfamily B protein
VDERADPLIGAHDLTTPAWAKGFESVAGAGLREMTAAAPRLMAIAVRWSWRASPRLTLVAAVVQLLSGVTTAFGLFATADVFTRLLAAGPTPERVLAALPALAVVVGAAAGRGLLQAAVGLVQGRLAPLVEQDAQEDLHAAVIDVELAAFDDADFTELVERAGFQGLSRVREIVNETGDLIALAVSVLASVITAGVLHPLLAPVVLIAALPQGWAAVRSARLMFASYLRTSSARRRLGITGQLITERERAAEVRAFTARGPLMAEHRRIAGEITEDALRVARDRTVVQLVGRTLSGIGSAGAYLVLALLIYFSVLPLALAGAAAVAMRTAAQAVSNAIYLVNHLYEAGFYVQLFRTCVTQARERRRAAATARLGGPPERIELTGVSFRYPGQEDAAVDGVDLVLRRGEVVALVGENGSGKSTLAKLITGLYLPEHGTVRWDGVDVAEVDTDELLTQVAVVLQDPVNWPMTARNNVRIGRLERTDPDEQLLRAASRGSGTDDVVATLPEGWATVLSKEFQGGHDLSGGQWQRVAVARGLFRDAPLVIADEPTAALDARAEHAVFGTLRGRTGSTSDRITVLVTHRLANVRTADQIVVMEHGRITEHGRHDELMALRGTYYDLFSLQARAYGS